MFLIYVGAGLWCDYGVAQWCYLVDGCCRSNLFVDDDCSAKEVVDLSEQ